MSIERKVLRELGFKDLPHFTIMHNLTYDIGRGRFLSIGDLGTPNEIGFLCQLENGNPTKITDIITIHNYDYDGYLTLDKVKSWIKVFNK
jgi:hypothetical protein